jgi:hypothetical protein
MSRRHPLRRPPLDPLAAIWFQRNCQRLHDLGPRALSEALLEIADRIGGLPAICATLVEYERLTPAMLAATGGDRLVPYLHEVPSDVEVRRHEQAI